MSRVLRRGFSRRSVLAAAAGTAAQWPLGASAQSGWPARTVKIIDAAAPGGSSDVVARLVATRLGPRLGQSVIVENKPGAGLSIGTDAVAKSAADGYMLLLTTLAMCTGAASGKKQPFDFLTDLMPIGLIAGTPLIIVVAADSPFKTLKDLIDRARSNPGELRYGSGGMGSLSHIGMAMFAHEAKLPLMHIPYKGTNQMAPALIGGEVQVLLGTIASYSALLESGRMKAVAVTSPQRSPLLPDVPTTTEAGVPGFQVETWFGLHGPTGLPAESVRRLNSELAAITAQADMREALKRLGVLPRVATPEEFGQLTALEVARWSRLIKDAKIQLE